MAKIYRGTKAEIERLGRALRAGRLVGVPTETVYGLAADALNARACREIFRVKGRPGSDPLIVHVGRVKQVEALAVAGLGARKLMRAFWPGPLTIVLPKREVVPDVVTAGRDSVAVRMPAHRMMRRLLAAAARPLAAPSANRFGYVSPTTAEHVVAGLGARIDYILDGGACEIGVESTIVDMRDEARPQVLRPGKIGRAEIARVLGVRVGGKRAVRVGARGGMVAPGMMARHYSPRTRVVLHARIRASDAAGRTEAWVFRRVPKALRGRQNVFAWGRTEQLADVARGVFSVLRRLDGQRWKAIHVEMVSSGRAEEKGLADAVNDRLRRAAARL